MTPNAVAFRVRAEQEQNDRGALDALKVGESLAVGVGSRVVRIPYGGRYAFDVVDADGLIESYYDAADVLREWSIEYE